ncbi:MAG TPA: redoxin domain-containing protein [Candidatus Baltobacteraceae bacterium]|jgi:thiol-disulfide isomerase/thioredoxin|nr:redoxin domain-containing protein [Candidatus Baltobacteraceae bacterium]
MRSPLPSFDGAADWINGAQPSAASLDGKPIVVQFWSMSCYMCHNAAEQVNAWRDKYEPLGFVFIAVHQPRSEAELDVEAVRKDALEEMKLTQLCALDNDHTIVDRFANQFVPSYYIFDRAHQLRHFQAGDKGFERIEAALDRVLHEPVPASVG